MLISVISKNYQEVLVFATFPILMKKYGKVFSLRMGSFKVVVAASANSVKEVLVKRSGDYAGRPPFHSFDIIVGGKHACIKMSWKVNCLAYFYVQKFECLCVPVNVRIVILVCACMRVCVCICVCLYVCMYVCMYVLSGSK